MSRRADLLQAVTAELDATAAEQLLADVSGVVLPVAALLAELPDEVGLPRVSGPESGWTGSPQRSELVPAGTPPCRGRARGAVT